MLRHLGATYYQTLHGQATPSDVRRALESVEAQHGHEHEPGHSRQHHRRGRWRIRDVMTTEVVAIDQATSYKEIARLMTEQQVNALPVVTPDGHVAGMVSEADVLRKEERNFRRLGTGLPARSRAEKAQAEAGNAGELMTSPVITIHPDAPLGAAARLMNAHRIRLLPVVNASGKLIGIVSRRDLLSVFFRPDEEIAAEVRELLTGLLLAEPEDIEVQVRDGVVTLAGTLAREDLIPAARRLTSDVDGVVTVNSELTGPAAATAETPSGASSTT